MPRLRRPLVLELAVVLLVLGGGAYLLVGQVRKMRVTVAQLTDL